MLHLLHPAALWSLAALALPLAIHLFHPPPRTVRLGSLRFLENASRRPLRNLRWRELLLLCTRLVLLAALAFLLAEPYWIIVPPAGPRRWALLDPTAAPSTESLARWHVAQRDSYELRRLAPGFPVTSTEFSQPADVGNTAAPDLWSLLREADAELPAGTTLAVFSPMRLEALRGVRPALGHCKVDWIQTPDATGNVSHEWVSSVSGQRVLGGRSDARSTVFTVKPPDNPAINHSAPPATSILILHDAEHANDAVYVEAAVRTAADSIGQPIIIQTRDITPDAENVAVTDWTFWLSARPVPEGLAGRAPRIVRYAGGDPVTGAGWIVAPSGNAANGVRLWKRVIAPPASPSRTVLWSDGQGNAVLTYTHPKAGECWDFYTRFDPSWTDLPRTTALPAALRAMLFPEAIALSDAGPLHDHRLVDPSQSLPAELPVAMIPALAPADQPSIDLHWPLWVLAAAFFAVERALSLLRRPVAPRGIAPDPHTEVIAVLR